MEIRTYQITCYVCPRCDERAVFDAAAGQVVRHDCGWGGIVTAILGTHGFCLDEREGAKPSSGAVSLHAELSQPSSKPFDFASVREPIEQLAKLNLEDIRAASGLLMPVYLSGIKITKTGERLRRIHEICLNPADGADHGELTAWRLAELQSKGEKAELMTLFTDRGAAVLLVKRGDGSIEDVSNELRKRRK